MTVARSVDDVLTEHVRFQVECIDRMFLNVYVPQLQYPAGLVGYVHRRLGLPIASTAPLAKITDAFSLAVHRFARDNGIPWVDFVKGQRRDDVMHEHLRRFTGSQGVLFVGRAQEKTKLFRTEKRRDANGDSYPWIVQTTGAGQPFLLLVRHEAPCHIPDLVRRNLEGNWSGRGGQPGLALGEHDEGVEEVPAVFGGGG